MYLQWKEQRISGSFLPHSYWPRDSDDPSSWCIVYKYCRQEKGYGEFNAWQTANANVINYPAPLCTKYVFKIHFDRYKMLECTLWRQECEGAALLLTCSSCSAYCVCTVLDWPAVVCPLRLDATALWALVDDLARLQLQALHIFLCCIALGNCTLKNRKRDKGKCCFVKRRPYKCIMSGS